MKVEQIAAKGKENTSVASMKKVSVEESTISRSSTVKKKESADNGIKHLK